MFPFIKLQDLTINSSNFMKQMFIKKLNVRHVPEHGRGPLCALEPPGEGHAQEVPSGPRLHCRTI